MPRSYDSPLQLLPYPGGKRFAFTIIDDTDAATLESVRPVYEYLHSLGLRTTKTVWAIEPESPPSDPRDAGDTLERAEYADYIRLLRSRGFEIALHNVSAGNNTRTRIESGMERFRQVLGEYPAINVHHEKNRENVYFDFAQTGGERPPLFQTALLRCLHRVVRPNGRPAAASAHACVGQDERSPYFWGDLCRTRIKYVRTNVFFRDLNTIKCNPWMPYSSPHTPFVRHWFDSSNGQDAECFNSILSQPNIQALKDECGCSILYTHFGKGFVQDGKGGPDLNPETKRRLQVIAGDADGWYATAGEILDRLLAFQRLAVLPLEAGAAIANRNPFDVDSVTLRARPGYVYCDAAGGAVAADPRGLIVLPGLAAGRTVVLLRQEACNALRPWHQRSGHPVRLDVETLARKFTGWRKEQSHGAAPAIPPVTSMVAPTAAMAQSKGNSGVTRD